MRRSTSTLIAAGAALACAATAQAGPDVIVADLPSCTHYGPVGTVHAYAVGTTSCNSGDAILNWISGTPDHPVITQNVYRVANGRFTQIGQGWLKHGFCALSGTLCGPCQSTGCDTLGVGCSEAARPGAPGRGATAACGAASHKRFNTVGGLIGYRLITGLTRLLSSDSLFLD